MPVMLSGVSNSFCSALSEGVTRSSIEDIFAPAESAVAVGNSSFTPPSPA